MRWVFLVVVLINAGFFSWHSFSQDSGASVEEKVYAPPVGKKIALMSEVAQSEKTTPINPIRQEAIERSKAVARLEDQLKAAVADAESVMAKGSVAPSVADLAAASCRMLETEREKDHKAIVSSLKTQGWLYKEDQKIGERDKYWLYIAAPDTRTAANAIVADLKRKGVDSFIINRGEMKNRISLGLYSSKVRAEQAAASIQSKAKYPVEVFEHKRNVSLYVVDILSRTSDEAFGNWLKTLKMEPTLIKIEKKSC